MNIHQIIPSTEGWRAVFYNRDNDSLIIRHVVAWATLSRYEEEDPSLRYIEGYSLEDGDTSANLRGAYDSGGSDDDIFLGYYARNVDPDQSALLVNGKQIWKNRVESEARKSLKEKLKRNPTQEEIDALLFEWKAE